ncbi:acetoacetate decarboxylase [Psychromonas sp. KJ10-2]|uniref:acetoacetate decarboxylase n=1 Tax=Psychromonas sp. KJ10-2 TaxID=3391822 RepID=UPI0039B6AFC6
MNIEQIKKLTSMPATAPTVGPDKVRCINREFFIVTYETDSEALQAVVPEPLQFDQPIVKFEVIKMEDFRGFGSFTESGQVIPVTLDGQAGKYVHQMYLNNFPAIAAGREIWGFPKKYAQPELLYDSDCVLGRVFFGQCEIARATMPYKWHAMDLKQVKQSMESEPGYLLKIIPNADNTPLITQLVKYHMQDVVVKEAWSGPSALELFNHALAPMAELPVKKVLSAQHIIADLTLSWGEVVVDYQNDY